MCCQKQKQTYLALVLAAMFGIIKQTKKKNWEWLILSTKKSEPPAGQEANRANINYRDIRLVKLP